MDSGYYAAYTGLLARTQALDTAANNLANAGTAGFRAQRETFRGVISSGLAGAEGRSQVGETVNNFGVLGGNRLDLSQGALATTGNPLDLGIDGAGFFAIQTQQGVRYTRDGSFTKSVDGQLQTAAGEAVLDTAGKPIVVPSGALQISADGTVSVDGNVVSRVGVFGFASSALTAEGTNRFAAVGPPVAADGAVRQGSVRRRERGCGAWIDADDSGATAGGNDAEGFECVRWPVRQDCGRGDCAGLVVWLCDPTHRTVRLCDEWGTRVAGR